jgi:hypothetical protein
VILPLNRSSLVVVRTYATLVVPNVMLTAIIQSTGFWGFLGALSYASLRLSLSIYGANKGDGDGRWGKTLMEMIVALVVGTVFGAAFTGIIAGFFHQQDLHAVACVIGLMANPVQPALEMIWKGRIEGAVKTLLGLP